MRITELEPINWTSHGRLIGEREPYEIDMGRISTALASLAVTSRSIRNRKVEGSMALTPRRRRAPAPGIRPPLGRSAKSPIGRKRSGNWTGWFGRDNHSRQATLPARDIL